LATPTTPVQRAGPVRRASIAQGITLVTAGFLPILAIISMFPAVPAMISHFSDDPAAAIKVPSMVTAPGLSIAIVALFAGFTVDRYGRRRLLLAATFAYAIIGAVPFFLESLDAVYASRLLLGVFEAFIITTLNTLIADYWDDRGRRHWLTIQNMAGPAISSAVIFFAGSLAAWKWNGIFLLYLVAFPIALAMLKWVFEPQRQLPAAAIAEAQSDAATAVPIPWVTLAQIGGLTLFSSVLYYVFIVNGGVVWQELGVADPARIGQLTALPSLFIVAGAIAFWVLGRLGLASRFQILIFLATLGAGLAVIGSATTITEMIIGICLQQTGAGMAIPVLIHWAQSQLPAAHRGRGMGVWTSAFFFGQFISPLIVNLVSTEAGSMQGAFFATGLVGVAGAVVALAILPSHTRAAVAPNQGAV
jgi:MFS family permease